MSNFYVGQKVVCVDNSSGINWKFNPLRRGGLYVVDGLRECACGNMIIDIGIVSYANGTACSCGRETNNSIWWFKQSRFKPLDNLIEQIERIENEGAPVELGLWKQRASIL